tara:strand:+ start:401 stop:1243 length:843 start_codon:yes stop_codon:yes gene_type:complete
MILKMGSKKFVPVTDDKNNLNEKSNFSIDRVELRDKIGVLSFSDLSERHFKFLLNHNFTQKANDGLAGHIENQFFFNDWPKDLEKYLISKVINENLDVDDLISKTLHDESLLKYANKIKPHNFYDLLTLSGMWINKQKKHEFNPMHNHTGSFSFIIPLQIPYDLNEEDKIFQVGRHSINKTSRLEFFKIIRGQLESVTTNMDKSWEGKLLMFPSLLHHQVYPFYTSDGIRITVSGNIVFKEEVRKKYSKEEYKMMTRLLLMHWYVNTEYKVDGKSYLIKV